MKNYKLEAENYTKNKGQNVVTDNLWQRECQMWSQERSVLSNAIKVAAKALRKDNIRVLNGWFHGRSRTLQIQKKGEKKITISNCFFLK